MNIMYRLFLSSTQESLTLPSPHPFTGVKSCQVSLSSAVGLIKRKTNSRFPTLGVARGRFFVFWCVGCCTSFAPLLFSPSYSSLSLSSSSHFPLSSCHPRGVCSAVMVSDSLPACSLPTHMPTLGHVPHGHSCARITELQELRGPKSKKKTEKSSGYDSTTWCVFRHNTET